VKLTNTGYATLNFDSVSLAGAEPDDFSLTNGCGSSLAVGASCTWSITFNPVSAALKRAQILVTDNATNSPAVFNISGTGIPAGAPPTTALNDDWFNFGHQTVGTGSAAQTITLTNRGGSALIISSITLTGATADDFVLSNGCPTSLGPSLSCNMFVTFKPVSAGSKTAEVALADNASGSPQIIMLNGIGVAAPN
jgi:hypothetical protein